MEVLIRDLPEWSCLTVGISSVAALVAPRLLPTPTVKPIPTVNIVTVRREF